MHGSHPVGAEPAGAQHRRRRWPVIVAVTVVVVVGGGLGFRAWLTAAPRRVTVGQAVDRYRSNGASSSSAALVPSGAPAAGVYVYLTGGQESVDALGGDTHVYPSPTTVTVTRTECGFQMVWMPVTGRNDTTDVCRRGGGLAVSKVVNAHEFFRISQAEVFTCADGSWWLPPAGVTRWTSSCTSDGGRTTARVGQVIGTENIAVGGENRAAVHVRWDDVITGSSTGTSATDYWLDPVTGLQLRQAGTASTGNETVIGHVTFDERIDLTLASTSPQT